MLDMKYLGDVLDGAAEYFAKYGVKPRKVFVGSDIMPELRQEVLDHRDQLVEVKMEITGRSRMYIDGMEVKLVAGNGVTFIGDGVDS